MRPRGKPQEGYDEDIQILTENQENYQNLNSKLSVSNNRMAIKRRQGCPQTILHMWDAIAYIRQQRQIPNFERLSGYMKRVYNLNPPDLERQLKFAVLDNLIIVKKTLGCKGSKIGVEQDGYRIPEQMTEKDGHDWYCFECHRGGEVILCTTCHRVYHQLCISNDAKTGKFICSVCKNNSEKFSVTLKRSDINTLLAFTCIRLKEKTKELHRIPHPDDEKWRFNFLIYEPMDLVAMEDKMKNNEYMRLGDFYTDALQIVHNVIVYFGMQSRIADMARQMLGDCEYDLQEIVQCSSCYKMSNMKSDAYWFCQPCDPPHELVFAKVKCYPYWPAKVIKKDADNNYDVRFFGGFHQRAIVEGAYVKPVTTNPKQLGVKKTASFDRAYKELQHHQRLVDEASKERTSVPKVQNNKQSEETNTDSEKTQDSFSSSKSKTLPSSRKRKSTSTPAAKPTNVKKSATVPLKKNKKFYQESPTSSSPKNSSSEDVLIQEDHNFVSSSSQETQVSHSSIGVQTEKELSEPEVGPSEKTSENKETKEDTTSKTEKACDCSIKYEKLLEDLQTRLAEEHKQDKSKALKELSEKLHLEMEAEKQRSLSALEKVQLKRKEALRKADEQRKAAYELELSKVLEQQKIELSETKRKQWCYNCENEAIYHCCWNTSYCSVECQQVHWHKEHKRTCRRKR